MVQKTELFDGFVGGGELQDDAVRSDLAAPKNLIVESELDKEIARLLILHPGLQVKFRNNNLSSLKDDTKRQLLDDMRDILGIRSPSYEENFR